MRFGHGWELLKKALAAWNTDNTLPLGAALAYYASFSISPLLVIVLAISGFFYRGDSLSYVRSEIGDLVGERAATAITAAIESVHSSEHGLAATVLSLVVLFLGASGVFVQLQNSLNQIWGVKPKPGHFIRDFLKQRLISFAMIVGVSFLLLVSLLMSAAVAAITAYFHYLLPGADFAWYTLDTLASFLLVVLIFAAIFKVVPDVHIGWNDVWVGAFITAILFTGGKSLIGFYLGRSGIGSAFGAAASVFVILAWVYYSSQILFLGAEFTKVYSEHHRFCVRPVRGAETVTDEARQRARGEMENIDSERAKKSA
ncbi:MAG: ribonuclease BN [Acidobacteria bacterium]|nr:MAG: ribonuclease BN [Acidobacteriota bacterium]